MQNANSEEGSNAEPTSEFFIFGIAHSYFKRAYYKM